MRSLRTAVAPLVLFSLLTLVLAFPIVAGLGSAVPGFEGDNLQFVRNVWWMKHALLDLRISPFFDPSSFHPVGEHIARSEMTPANTILALPITAAWSAPAAYNLIVLFSFVATAMGTYLWVRELTGRRMAGILAGVIAAFLPLRFAHIAGHLPEITTQWVPFTLFAFERFLVSRTPRRAAALGVCVALVALACWYYGYGLAVMLPVYVLCRTWRAREVWRDGRWWRGIAVSVAVALVLTLPFIIPAARLQRGGELNRSIVEMDVWSLNPYDFFLPNLVHPLWIDTARELFPIQLSLWVERGVVLGYVACALALIGLARGRPRPVVRAIAGVWLVSYLIALGPTLHFRNEPVRIPIPRAVEGVFSRALGVLGPTGTQLSMKMAAKHHVPIVLPSFFLYYLVPATSSMRIMSRFGLWTGLMTAALAGFGVLVAIGWAQRRWGQVGRPMLAASVAAVAFESFTPIQMLPLAPRPVDRWLASQPPATVIVELPVDQAIRAFQNYYATVHGRSMIFGWNGDSFPPPEYERRIAALRGFPSHDGLTFLRERGATHVLFTPSQIPDWPTLAARLAGSGLRFERQVGDVLVYRVR